MIYTNKSAVVSDCGRFRYRLDRRWDDTKPTCMFLMLNPSLADGCDDDATIRRVVGFADRWGFGALVVVNLFAIRATNPKILVNRDPAELIGGDRNAGEITLAAVESECHIAAWGNWGSLYGRGRQVRDQLLHKGIYLRHLGLTLNAQPRHPLRLSYTTPHQPLD